MSKRKQSPVKQLKLVNKDMSINLVAFKTDSGLWNIVGTRSEGRETIDELRRSDGHRETRTRQQLSDLEKKGFIYF